MSPGKYSVNNLQADADVGVGTDTIGLVFTPLSLPGCLV